MPKLRFYVFGPLLAILLVPVAQAQVTIDVSKITCEQFLQSKVANPRTIGVWLSGFYAGKRNTTVVDTQSVERSADKVARYCETNKNTGLMQAVETALGTEK